VVTRPADTAILRGVTRMALIDVLAHEGLRFEERAFSVKEARDAREAFLTSATTAVTPIVSIDGRAVGDGKPGPVALALRAHLRRDAHAKV
jgi:D-alanine transaminase